MHPQPRFGVTVYTLPHCVVAGQKNARMFWFCRGVFFGRGSSSGSPLRLEVPRVQVLRLLSRISAWGLFHLAFLSFQSGMFPTLFDVGFHEQ